MLHYIVRFRKRTLLGFNNSVSSKHQVVVTGDTRYEQVTDGQFQLKPDTEFFSGQAILIGLFSLPVVLMQMMRRLYWRRTRFFVKMRLSVCHT